MQNAIRVTNTEKSWNNISGQLYHKFWKKVWTATQRNALSVMAKLLALMAELAEEYVSGAKFNVEVVGVTSGSSERWSAIKDMQISRHGMGVSLKKLLPTT